jgi:hypothetical protein
MVAFGASMGTCPVGPTILSFGLLTILLLLFLSVAAISRFVGLDFGLEFGDLLKKLLHGISGRSSRGWRNLGGLIGLKLELGGL